MAAEKKISPNVESRLRHNILKMPQCFYKFTIHFTSHFNDNSC